MLSVTNDAGFQFVWPDGSPFVEVYHRDVAFADQPYEAILAVDVPRTEKTLKKLAFNTSDYARL